MKRSARSLGPDDLVLSYFSLARDHPFEDRVAAAAAAGYAGIGLYLGEYARLLASGVGPAQIRELLDRHGLCVAEIEALRGWGGRDGAAKAEALAWDMANQFECRYLQAIGPYDGTIDDAGRAFASLCDRAGDHGLLVGIEFLPFTNIVTAGDALAIVERADRANGGVCVDIWHHQRGADDIDMIRAIPGEKIMAIQMSDGPIVPEHPDYYTDCLHNRLPPGDGLFNVDGFVRTVIASGTSAPWSLEVCQDSAWGKPASPHVSRCADGMRTALRTARGHDP